MASKFEIIGQHLVVTDTISLDVVFQAPKSKAYFNNFALTNSGSIILIDTSYIGTDNDKFTAIELAKAEDANGTPFTETTFRQFMSETGFDLALDNTGAAIVNNGSSFDAFGRLEASLITTQLDLKQSSGELVEFIDKVEIGTGTVTYNTGSSSTTLSVTTTSDHAICQTFQRTNYQTGKAKVVKMTFNSFQSETNVIKRVGYFSGDFGTPYTNNLDGCWLRSDGTDIYTNVYRSGTQSSRVASGNWNGDDISGVDWSKNQLLKIEFAWLGVAAVRWSLFHGGEWVNFHTDIFDNTLTTPYMIYPNHPIRWEVLSSGGSGSMTFICASAEIEGAENQLGRIKGIDRGSVHQNANNTANTYANIGIALDETKPLTFRNTVVDIVSGSTVALTQDAYVWRLYINPTITGTAISWNSINNSGVKYFVGADNNIITGGQIITSGYVTQRGDANIATDNSIKLGVDLDGNSDVFVLGIQPLGANLDILGSINWRELD